jgi:hydrogenase expression/formation protein HypC
MCVSLPGMVVSVQGPLAVVETAGLTRRANAMMFPELAPGDRVLVHAGRVVRALTVAEAQEIEAAFAELGVL